MWFRRRKVVMWPDAHLLVSEITFTAVTCMFASVCAAQSYIHSHTSGTWPEALAL